MDPSPTTPDQPQPRPEPAGPVPRRPRIHASFLVVFGLTGVAYAGFSILGSANETVQIVLFVAVLLAWLMNAAWLTVVVKDGANVLGPEITVGPTRAFMLALMACAGFPAWTTLAITWLARDTLARFAAIDRVHLVPALPKCVRHGGEVVFVFFIWFIVEVVVFGQVAEANNLEGNQAEPLSQLEALGTTNALLLTLFRLGGTAYFLQFLAKSVPVLYEAFALLGAQANARRATEGEG